MSSNLVLTIKLLNPDLDSEELESATQKLTRLLKSSEEVESVNRVVDQHPPEGNKSIGSFLIGVVTAEVSFVNIKRLLNFLSDRLSNQPIEIELEVNGKKIKIKASSREEFAVAIQAVQDLSS
ncbi:MAG: hypothetical protein IV090_24895 [Candidatus Sericytochromatia bacterium]|nr:hypothetical protein [Candidatus Sericytochromatia bacterium]